MTGEVSIPGFEQHLAMMGFRHNPFPVVPDARHYLMTDTLRDIAHELLFAISQRKGFVVVTGDVGVGKTTLSRYLINRMGEQEYAFALVLNSYLQEEDLIDAILKDFGLDEGKGEGLQSRLDRLNQFFLKKRADGCNCVVIVDDAQNLSIKSLEAIRLLSNLETESEKLVQVLLIGQSELHDSLNLDALRQLKSRVVMSRQLSPFSKADLDRYIIDRLSGENVEQKYEITRAALGQVYKFSGGNLRRTNLLLDRALLGLLPTRSAQIDSALIKACIKDITGVGKANWSRLNSILLGGLLLMASASLAYVVSGASMTVMLAEARNTLWPAERQDPMPVPAMSTPPVKEITPVIMATSWKEYLQRFHLEALYDKSWQLLQNQDYTGLASLLEEASVYRVTLLPTTVVNGGKLLSAYEVPVGDSGSTSLLYIWEATLDIREFHIGQVSPSIQRMQEILAGFGFYTARIDGKVGIKTIQALMYFQLGLGLPVSGVVDDATLLALNYPGMFSS